MTDFHQLSEELPAPGPSPAERSQQGLSYEEIGRADAQLQPLARPAARVRDRLRPASGRLRVQELSYRLISVARQPEAGSDVRRRRRRLRLGALDVRLEVAPANLKPGIPIVAGLFPQVESPLRGLCRRGKTRESVVDSQPIAAA
jgi:hypothetical protein